MKILLVESSALVSSSNGATRQVLQGPGLTPGSRTPSEDQALEDSAYQSHSHGLHGSKSSSVASSAKFPSEESFVHRRTPSSRSSSPMDEKSSAEWYAEYRNQSFGNMANRPDYMRSKSQFDAHIAEIKGIVLFLCSFVLFLYALILAKLQ